MFFILSKVLAFLITPIVWIIVLLLFSLFNKNQKRKRKFLGAAVILLLFFSNSFLFGEAMRCWEITTDKDSDIKTVYDAGIVLSGIIVFDQAEERLQFNRRNDRLMQAVILYKKGIIKKIFFTGGSGSIEHPGIKEGLIVRKFLLDIGIPERDIVIESESDNTYQNAIYSKPLLEKNFTNGKFLLITSSFHMRRSLACFSKAGVKATPYSTDRYSGERKFVFDQVFIPNSETLNDWESLLHEVAGYLIYKIFGYA